MTDTKSDERRANRPVPAEPTTTTEPPGPKLPVTVQTVLFGRYRHVMLPMLRRRYGDTFMIRIAPHRRRLVVLCDPADIRTAFTGSAEIFHAGEGNAILGPVMGDHSVLLLDEKEHQRIRRLLMPAFHGNALRDYRLLMKELVADAVGKWPVDEPIKLHPRMQELTLDIILRVVFGVTDPQQLADLRPIVGRIVTLDPIAMLGWFYPRLRRIWPWRSFNDLQSSLDTELYRIIADRRANPTPDGADVLSRLLATSSEDSTPLTDAELRDNLITLLLAGHETTATGLAWACHELARSPEQQRKAIAAADGDDPDYLTAAFREALRLHPVIYEVARRVTRPVELGGYLIRAGATVAPGIGLVQSDSRFHDSPDRFDVSRFVGQSPVSNTWIPFGGGVRRCLGAGFAELEAAVVLDELFSRFELDAGGRRPEGPRARNITLAPRYGARVWLRRRPDAPSAS